jgi:hypothetical protein
MRKSISLAAVLVALLADTAVESRAVIVDRVAVAVGNKVITQSDIDRRIRLTAFENSGTPDFSLASRKEAAERLIDQRLVEREMDIGQFPRVALEHEKELLAAYEKSNHQSDYAALRRRLAAYGLSESDLEDDLARQQNLLTFLDLRFRPAVQVAEQDVQKYFDEKIPEAGEQQTLSALRPEIERLLANERADRDLEDWLKDQRRRTRIDYVDKDLANTEAATGAKK